MRKEESVYKNKSLYCDLDKKGMIVTGFAQVDNNVMKELCIDFHPNVAIVYFMLISHRHGDKKHQNYNQCFPTKDMLSKETGLSEKTVIKCIKTLADNEYILYRQGNSQLANQYFFPLEEFYQGEGDYLLNVVEDIIDVDTEDIPTEDNNNLPFLSGDILEDKETFTPKGKYVNEIDNDDIFDDILPPVSNSDGYVKVFYDNMVKYYDITDETLANNNHIDKKINSLIGYVKEELVKNDILDITAEKVITDILKGNRKSFTTSLAGKNFPKQFYKYVYLISCIQNNFTKKKLTALIKKHNKAKVADKVVDKVDNSIDGNLAEDMNNYYDDDDMFTYMEKNSVNSNTITDFPVAEDEEYFFNEDAKEKFRELFG
jgi:hypothetical protein